MITYPLSLPQTNAIRQVELRAINAVAISRSPFTFGSQVHAYAGQMWQADITLKPMRRSDAEQWIAWLISLRGQYGTFLLGDPLGCTPRGLASSLAGTPVVNGAGQTGGSLNITGASKNKTGWLLAGDYVQFGTGSASTLHKVLQNVNTDGSGNATLDLWPHIRTAPSSGSTVVVSNAKGLFRLATNEQSWSVNEASIYGVTFGAMEAI